MQVTYLGQSGFLFDIDGVTLLFDPFISGNPLAKDKIDVAALKPDFILISHGHSDHVGDVEKIAAQSGATVVAMHEIAQWFSGHGVKNIMGMNLGGTVDLKGIKAQMVPAWHSSTLPDGTDGGTAAGFVVTHSKGTFYYSGDTALFAEMKLFARRHKIDTAFLCLGGHYTMDAVDAAHAAQFVGAQKVIGMHFDTFPPIVIDHAATKKLFADAQLDFILPEIGESFAL